MKLRILMAALALALAACSGTDDAGITSSSSDPLNDPSNSGSATTIANNGSDDTDSPADSDTTLGSALPPDTNDSTTLLQSGSSTSLATETTFEVFETDPNETYAIPAEDIPPGQNPAYYTEFVVEQGNLQVIWDRWWWGLLDGKGDVKVVQNDAVVAEGEISGSSAVQVQDPSTGAISIYGPNGDVVATVTQQDLTEAIRTAQAEANIG